MEIGENDQEFDQGGHVIVNIPGVIAGGELGIWSNNPNNAPTPQDGGFVEPFPLLYVQWGTGAPAGSLAQRVVDEGTGFWDATADFVTIEAGDTGFVGIGGTATSAGYGSCNHAAGS